MSLHKKVIESFKLICKIRAHLKGSNTFNPTTNTTVSYQLRDYRIKDTKIRIAVEVRYGVHKHYQGFIIDTNKDFAAQLDINEIASVMDTWEEIYNWMIEGI